MSVIVKKPKGKSVTVCQKETIVDFMKIHPELSKGKFTQNFTKKKSHELWNELTKSLHALVGAVKTPQQWRKVSYMYNIPIPKMTKHFIYS